MKRLKLLLLPIAILLLSGTCQKAADDTNNTYIIPVNGYITFSKGSIEREIYFDSVVMDNRCPPNVHCIVAGEGVCRFTVKNGQQTQQITLSTLPGGTGAVKYPREGEISNLRITLEALTPFPRETYNDYKAQLVITAL